MIERVCSLRGESVVFRELYDGHFVLLCKWRKKEEEEKRVKVLMGRRSTYIDTHARMDKKRRDRIDRTRYKK